MLIQQGLVQQTSAAVFWHRLLSAFLLLSLESEEMLLESEEMEDMESDGEGFCSSEREKKSSTPDGTSGFLLLLFTISPNRELPVPLALATACTFGVHERWTLARMVEI